LFNYAILNTIPIDTATLEVDERSGNINEQSVQFLHHFLQTNPPLTDTKLKNEYLNFCNLRLSILKAKINVYTNALTQIATLMTDLKKEFHLSADRRTPLEK
jgi:hypothetical protein